MKLAELNASPTPTKTSQFKTKAERPRFSALRTIKLSKYGIPVRDWKEALRDHLVEKHYITTP